MEKGSIAARGAYQRVKERLVGLTVELDDKEHTSVLLSQIITKERIDSQKQIEEKSKELKLKYDEQTEIEKKKLHETIGKCDDFLAEKADIVSQLRTTTENLKKANEITMKKVDEVKKEGEKELEVSKKTWKDGENDRKKKFLARKLQEAKETTMKGLEPELETIRSKHDHEVQVLNAEAETQLLSALQELNVEHEKVLTELEEKANQKHCRKVDAEAAAFRQRKDNLSRQHNERLRTLKSEYSEEFSEQRRIQRQELEQSRLPQQERLSRVRLEEERRLEALRMQHTEELGRMEKNHINEINQANKVAHSQNIIYAQNIRNKILGKYSETNNEIDNKTNNNNNHININEANEYHNTTSLSRIGHYLNANWSTQELDSYLKERFAIMPSASSSSSSTSSSTLLLQEIEFSKKLKENVDVIEKERDEKIESMIRKLEAQQVIKEEEIGKKFLCSEKELKLKHDEEVSRQREQQLSIASEMSQVREQMTRLIRERNNTKARLEVIKKEYDNAESDLKLFRESAKKVKQDLAVDKRSVELKHSLAGEEGREETASALKAIAEMESWMSAENAAHEAKLKETRGKHQKTLQDMHLRVKALVASRSDEIVALTDAINVEKAKADKLKDLIEAHGGADVTDSPRRRVSCAEERHAKTNHANRKENDIKKKGDGGGGGGGGSTAGDSHTTVAASPPRMKFLTRNNQNQSNNRKASSSPKDTDTTSTSTSHKTDKLIGSKSSKMRSNENQGRSSKRNELRK